MTAFYFVLCMLPDPSFAEGFRLARCYHWDRAVCEAVYGECHEGFVRTPVRRSATAFPTR